MEFIAELATQANHFVLVILLPCAIAEGTIKLTLPSEFVLTTALDFLLIIIVAIVAERVRATILLPSTAYPVVTLLLFSAVITNYMCLMRFHCNSLAGF